MKKVNEKLNNFSVNLSVAILGLLAVGLVVTIFLATTEKAHAELKGRYVMPALEEEDNSVDENPLPEISSISPNKASATGSSLTINITGGGFIPKSVARWNGSNRQTTFIDSYHLVMYLERGDVLSGTTKYVTVYNPGPGGGYSNGAAFTISGGATATSGNTTSGKYKAPSVSTAKTITNGSSSEENVEEKTESTSGSDFSNLASNAIYGNSNSSVPSGLTQWLILAILILIAIIVVRKLYFEKKYHDSPLKHA